jgi:hypothetical protein
VYCFIDGQTDIDVTVIRLLAWLVRCRDFGRSVDQSTSTRAGETHKVEYSYNLDCSTQMLNSPDRDRGRGLLLSPPERPAANVNSPTRGLPARSPPYMVISIHSLSGSGSL